MKKILTILVLLCSFGMGARAEGSLVKSEQPVTTLTSGQKYYINTHGQSGQSTFLQDNGTKAVAAAYTVDNAFVWTATAVSGGYTLQNLATGRYLQLPVHNTNVLTAIESATLSVTLRSGNDWNIWHQYDGYATYLDATAYGTTVNGWGNTTKVANGSGSSQIVQFYTADEPATTLTYEYYINGVKVHAGTPKSASVGSAYPELDALPYGVTAAKPSGSVTELGKKRVDLSWNLPFDFAPDYASINQWYLLRVNPAGTNNMYYYDGTQTPNVKANKTDAPTAKYAWAIVGNPFDGFTFYNLLAGSSKALSNSNKCNVTASGTTVKFKLEEGNEANANYFSIVDPAIATGSKYLNGNTELGRWSKDGGSTFTVEPATIAEFPFLASDSYETAHWYFLKIRNTKYVAYDATNNCFNNTTTAPTSDAGLFAFIGSFDEGFKIYNKAAGSTRAIGGNITNNAILSAVDAASAKTFAYQNNSGHDVFAVAGADANAHVNDVNGKLGIWIDGKSATDDGSTFTFLPTEILPSTAAKKHYYTIRNADSKTNNKDKDYAHYAGNSSNLTLSPNCNNAAIFYFTSAGAKINGFQPVHIHNYAADEALTMNGWANWGTTNPMTWYVRLATGTTSVINDYNICNTTTNVDNATNTTWNHQGTVKAWSAGADLGSAWYIQEVFPTDCIVEFVDPSATLYYEGEAIHHGDPITVIAADPQNFFLDEAATLPYGGTVEIVDGKLIFGAKEYTVEGGTRPEGVSEMTLWYNQPASSTGAGNPWMDYGLPIGNGQIGAVMLGDVFNDKIQFNEKTLWEGTPTIGSAWAQGYYRNFGWINVKDLGNSFSKMDASKPVQNYNRYLDIEKAVSGVNYSSTSTRFARNFFVSAPDQILVGRYTAEGTEKLHLQFSYTPDAAINAGTVSYNDGVASFSGKLATVTYNTKFKVVSNDGTITSDVNGITVSDASEVLIYMSAATNFDLYADTFTNGTQSDVEAQNLDRINAAQSKGWESLLAAHTANFAEKMSRVDIDFNGATSTLATNALVDNYAVTANRTGADGLFLEKLYFQYGRYLAISSNNINTTGAPANLQGIWNERSNGFWHCDLHADVNVQMCYWPMEAANLSELHKPFLDHIIELSKDNRNYRNVAKAFKSDARGWMLSTENNIFGGISTWETNRIKTLNAWNCSHLWQHYQYTKDKEFLKEALPTMLGAAQFIKDISLQDTNDGTWYVANEYSPEHGPAGHSTAFAQQNSAEVMSEIIAAAEVLGNDLPDGVTAENIQEIRDFYEVLDKGLRTESYQNKTCLSEWKDLTLNSQNDAYDHRHLSHLMALYPYNQVSPYDSDLSMFNAAVNSLAVRDANNVTGWAMGWKVNLYARALDADKAHSFINLGLKHSDAYEIAMAGKGGCYYNLWDAHAPFQIDGNFGITAGVCEMLLQSYDGTLHLLPALPSAWPNGHVNGLKAVGDFTVNQQWASGALTEATIVNNIGSALRVQYDALDLTNALVTVNGQKVTPVADGKAFVIDCKKGDVVSISFLTCEENVGKFVRLEKDGAYLKALADGQTELTSDAAAATAGETIFYNDGGQLVAFKTGLYATNLPAGAHVTTVTSLPLTIASSGYTTFYAPVAMQVAEGAKAYVGSVDAEETTITYTALSDDLIPACTGVLLKGEGGASASIVTTDAAVEPQASDLLGTIEAKPCSQPAEGPFVYTLQSGEFKYFTGERLAGFKAYLQLARDHRAADSALRTIFADDTLTAITSAAAHDDITAVYDLQGRRVHQMQKGLYIADGKKVTK